MSRTIRRTKTNKRHPRFEKDYTHYHLKEWGDMVQSKWKNDHKAFPFVPKPEKEFIKAKWRFHSDNGLAIFGWEDAFERPWRDPNKTLRKRYKAQITKWMKNPDYEIQFSRPKQIWDLC